MVHEFCPSAAHEFSSQQGSTSDIRHHSKPSPYIHTAFSHLPRVTLIHTHTMFQPVNPKPYLTSLLGHQVVVRLKFSGTEYHGTLKSIDNYMNLLMAADVIELEQTPGTIPDLTKGTKLGSELFVRCNNVLWVGKAETGEQVPAEEHTETEGTVIEGEKV